MTAYVFKNSDRRIFNKVENVVKVDQNLIISNTETMIINEDDDFVITDSSYQIGDHMPNEETNKDIITAEEMLMLAVAELDAQREQDKIETQLAIAELAETILGGGE